MIDFNIEDNYKKELIKYGSESKIFKDLPKDVNQLSIGEALYLIEYCKQLLNNINNK